MNRPKCRDYGKHGYSEIGRERKLKWWESDRDKQTERRANVPINMIIAFDLLNDYEKKLIKIHTIFFDLISQNLETWKLNSFVDGTIEEFFFFVAMQKDFQFIYGNVQKLKISTLKWHNKITKEKYSSILKEAKGKGLTSTTNLKCSSRSKSILLFALFIKSCVWNQPHQVVNKNKTKEQSLMDMTTHEINLLPVPWQRLTNYEVIN